MHPLVDMSWMSATAVHKSCCLCQPPAAQQVRVRRAMMLCCQSCGMHSLAGCQPAAIAFASLLQHIRYCSDMQHCCGKSAHSVACTRLLRKVHTPAAVSKGVLYVDGNISTATHCDAFCNNYAYQTLKHLQQALHAMVATLNELSKLQPPCLQQSVSVRCRHLHAA